MEILNDNINSVDKLPKKTVFEIQSDDTRFLVRLVKWLNNQEMTKGTETVIILKN